MNNQVKIVDTGNLYGNMNTAGTFYPSMLPREYRNYDFLVRRIILGNQLGFDGRKMFMANQDDKKGTYRILNDEEILTAEDSWKVDIKEDILVITDKAPGIVAGHPVADCPVVMASDRENGVTAVCHCSGELVDRKLPALTVEALMDAEKVLGLNAKKENVMGYISACAGPNWTYDRYPGWITNDEVWKYAITENNGIYNINISQAIMEQFREYEIEDVRLKLVDTITHPNYYSNSASRNDKVKAGRQFIGAFYADPQFVPTNTIDIGPLVLKK